MRSWTCPEICEISGLRRLYMCLEVVPTMVDFYGPILIGQTVDNITELWNRIYH